MGSKYEKNWDLSSNTLESKNQEIDKTMRSIFRIAKSTKIQPIRLCEMKIHWIDVKNRDQSDTPMTMIGIKFTLENERRLP